MEPNIEKYMNWNNNALIQTMKLLGDHRVRSIIIGYPSDPFLLFEQYYLQS